MSFRDFLTKSPFIYNSLKGPYFFVKGIEYCIIFFLVILFTKRNPKSNELLIIRPDGIGDIIVWLDTAKEYKRIFKNHRLTLLCNSECVELIHKLKYFDSIISINQRKFGRSIIYRFLLFRNIAKSGYHTIISTRYSRHYFCDDAIVRISGAAERIGFDSDLSNITLKQKIAGDRLYTNLIKAKKITLHELERNAEFIRGIGFKNFTCGIPKLPDKVLPKNILKEQKEQIDAYCVLFPGAGAYYRRWPIKRFSEIVIRTHEHIGLACIICGSSGDKILASEILNATPGVHMIDMTGKASILELATIIRDAAAVITNETSAAHIAAAVSTPAVCILGGGHYGRFMPIPEHIKGAGIISCVSLKRDCFNCNWKCIHKTQTGEPFPCIKDISVDNVWEKLELIFNKGNTKC